MWSGLKGMDAIGATLPGTPFVVLGRTPEVAWGFTNTGPDVQDLYPGADAIPATPASTGCPHRGPGAWPGPISKPAPRPSASRARPTRQMTVRTIAPWTGDQRRAGRTQDLIDSSRYALALRWTALDPDNHNVQASLESNRVRSVDELIAGFQPFLRADAKRGHGRPHRAHRLQGRGHDAIACARQRHPRRGTCARAGRRATTGQGWLPYEETPEDDGSQGWIATANQRIHGPDYPHFRDPGLGAALPQGAHRQPAGANAPSTPSRLSRPMHGDQTSHRHAALVAVSAEDPVVDHPLAAAAQKALADFDGDHGQDSAAPLIYTAWVDEFTRGVIGGRLGQARFEALYGKRLFRNAVEDILERDDAAWCGSGGCCPASTAALDRALDRLKVMQGDDVAAWRWGEAHPAISIHRPFSNVGALAPLV